MSSTDGRPFYQDSVIIINHDDTLYYVVGKHLVILDDDKLNNGPFD